MYIFFISFYSIVLLFSAGDIDLSLLYLLHPPLSFSKTFISYYLGLDNCMKALPLVILFPLFKRCFSVNDSFWAVLGILSKAFGCILFGSSHVLWLVFCGQYNLIYFFSCRCLLGTRDFFIVFFFFFNRALVE